MIDADLVARRIVEPGEPALRRIVQTFGAEVLDAEGRLDRSAMRSRIAHDAGARRALESVTHPAIRAAIAQNLAALADAGHPAAVVEAALLVETGSARDYPALIVVTCAPDVQLKRLLSRDGTTREDAEALIRSQWPLADKEGAATHIIRNDGDLAALESRTEEVWREILST